MSTLVVDTPANRSNERLTNFMTEIGAEKPIDNYFKKAPTWEFLMKTSKKKSGGRQIGFPIDSGENTTVFDGGDADTFSCTVPDTALWVAYAYVNKLADVTVLGEEQRETEGSNHKIFNIIDHRRSNVINTVIKRYTTDFFATTLVAGKINPIHLVADSSGAVGGLNASTDTDWAGYEDTGGSFASQGLVDMRDMYNAMSDDKANIDAIVTTTDVYGYYETEIDPDVRYSTPQAVGGRGFKSLEFKGVPIIHDASCTSGYLFMWDSEYNFLACDTGWNMDFEPFVSPANQKVSVSKFANRCQFVSTNRRTAGKLTTISA